MADPEQPALYVAEHLREELVRHPEVGELDVHVSVDGDRIVVTGHVSTQERSDAISRILAELAELAGGRDVRNETTVSVYPEAPEGTPA